jgi:hypothetical protein
MTVDPPVSRPGVCGPSGHLPDPSSFDRRSDVRPTGGPTTRREAVLKRSIRILVAAAVMGAVLVLPATPASAHESRQVGDYEFVVGWYDEPAFANAKNGPEVTITDSRGDPVVEGVDLQVELGFEDQTMTAELEPAFVVGVFGEPGNYNTDLYPTRPGTWTFTITGTVEDLEVDETFTSGPETFSDIEDPGAVAFPVEDPSNAELADQVDQVEQASAEAATPDDVSSARTLAYVGIAAGILGVLVAVIALWRKRTA